MRPLFERQAHGVYLRRGGDQGFHGPQMMTFGTATGGGWYHQAVGGCGRGYSTITTGALRTLQPFWSQRLTYAAGLPPASVGATTAVTRGVGATGGSGRAGNTRSDRQLVDLHGSTRAASSLFGQYFCPSKVKQLEVVVAHPMSATTSTSVRSTLFIEPPDSAAKRAGICIHYTTIYVYKSIVCLLLSALVV